LDDPPIATLGGDTVECPVQKDLSSVCTPSEHILSSGCFRSTPVSLQCAPAHVSDISVPPFEIRSQKLSSSINSFSDTFVPDRTTLFSHKLFLNNQQSYPFSINMKFYL